MKIPTSYVWVFLFLGQGLCIRCSCLYNLASLCCCYFSFMKSVCSTQSSSVCSPHSPRCQKDTCKASRSFSSRPESQGGQGSQDHAEKVFLNLEEVKVSMGCRDLS